MRYKRRIYRLAGLMVLMAVLLLPGASPVLSNPASATLPGEGMRSGGIYVLDLQPAPGKTGPSQSIEMVGGSYRLTPLAMAGSAAETSGCCCKCLLPVIIK